MAWTASRRGTPGPTVAYSESGYLGSCDTTVRNHPFFCRAGVNVAGKVHGAQLGLANYSSEFCGLSLGALNWVDGVNEGVPVGLVNLADNGRVTGVAFSSNLSLFNVGVRTEVNRFYSMLTGGTGDALDEIGGTLFLTWNFGYEIIRTEKFMLGRTPDLFTSAPVATMIRPGMATPTPVFSFAPWARSGSPRRLPCSGAGG